jgi:exonuclease III
MRVVTWNLHGANGSRRGAWEYLLELKPDLALLQEVGSIPREVAAEFDCRELPATTKSGSPQRFKTAVLVKGRVGEDITLTGSHPSIDRELDRFRGNLVAIRVQPRCAPPINVISVYNPAWPLERGAFADCDLRPVRLSLQPRDVWLADLLWFRLVELTRDRSVPWLIGGDFNLSESFDDRAGGPRGNREYLERMKSLDLVECLRHFNSGPVPTFKNPDGGAVVHQIDHLFASKELAAALSCAVAGSPDRVFGGKLSDHLPVIADFDVRRR